MSKKTKKDKKQKPRPQGKPNQQIPISKIRALKLLGPRHYLEHAREYPIHGCWIMSGWHESGMTPVVVAREQEPGKVMFGVYMVDLYCLGIKDVYTKTDYSLSKFERELPIMCANQPEKCSVELAHEVIYGGMEYAQRYGFQPHPDFKVLLADLMLDPPEAHPRMDHVAFGKDGKPFYVSGPYDDERKARFIVETLMRTAGEGNFDYLMGLGEMSDILDDEDLPD
jgi:hypothetical protein